MCKSFQKIPYICYIGFTFKTQRAGGSYHTFPQSILIICYNKNTKKGKCKTGIRCMDQTYFYVSVGILPEYNFTFILRIDKSLLYF